MPDAVGGFHGFCGKACVPSLRYSFEDMEEERQTAGRLKSVTVGADQHSRAELRDMEVTLPYPDNIAKRLSALVGCVGAAH